MKKVMMVFAIALALAASAAYAETTKDVAKKTGDFWAREGERSGMKDSTSSWGKFWGNWHPGKFFNDQQEAYNARKAGAVAK